VSQRLAEGFLFCYLLVAEFRVCEHSILIDSCLNLAGHSWGNCDQSCDRSCERRRLRGSNSASLAKNVLARCPRSPVPKLDPKLRSDTASGHTPTMTLKDAALLALIGTILMTVLFVWTFVLACLNVLRDLIPVVTVFSSFMHARVCVWLLQCGCVP
jgi:hypothetical protein